MTMIFVAGALGFSLHPRSSRQRMIVPENHALLPKAYALLVGKVFTAFRIRVSRNDARRAARIQDGCDLGSHPNHVFFGGSVRERLHRDISLSASVGGFERIHC